MEDGRKPKGIDWRRGAGAVICTVAALVVFWLVFRYVPGVALPFLIAYLLSRLIKPFVERICRRGRIPRPPVAAVLVILFVGVVVLLAAQGIRRGISEISRFVGELSADSDGVVAAVSRLLERASSISEHIPFLRRFEDSPGYADFCARLDSLVKSGIDRLVGTVGNALPDAAMTVAGRLPGAFIFVTVLLLACYYFSADDGRLSAGLRQRYEAWIPERWRDRLTPIGHRLRRLGRQYLRAYVILGLFTFLEVFIGLTVLGVRYAFILSWLIALVDFLPLLGTGVVLVPWGIICLLLGEYKLGVGLLILFGICTLLRQLLEPRFIGRGLGLHPLVSLLSMYVGLRFFGVLGMLLAPLLCAVGVGLLPEVRRKEQEPLSPSTGPETYRPQPSPPTGRQPLSETPAAGQPRVDTSKNNTRGRE